MIIEEKQSEQKKLKNTLDILEKQRKELLSREKNLKIEKIDIDKTVLEMESSLAKIKKKIDDAPKKINEISEKKYAINALKKIFKGQKEFYRVTRVKRGVSTGDKYARKPQIIPRVFGTVADMFQWKKIQRCA